MFTSPGAVAFELFGMDIRWYGICVAAGVLIGTALSYYRAPNFGISRDNLIDVLLVAIPAGIVGARLYYVIFNWQMYAGDFAKIINFREGGLAIHGGLILGIIAGACMCIHHRISLPNLLDLLAPGFAIGQAIGRWGNFFNSEAHGGPTDLPWAVIVNGQGVHPTFLYESLWCLLLFVFLMLMSRNIKFSGQIFCLYAVLYSVERFFVEGLRTDSLMIGPFRQAQVLSLSLIVIFAVVYILLCRRSKRI